ncbi:Methyltransferase domain-containing protein [Desulfonatronum zhilinae]|nr:Methyltransferase domain-containing protein [Desulfonatronum zhilinae]
MAQCTTGWRSWLSLPGVYSFCMDLLGGKRGGQIFVDTCIRPQSGMSILDIGCGPAAILGYLPEGVEYVGVDVSQQYIDAATRQHGGRGRFFCMSVDDLSENDFGVFDLVLGTGVLHHLDDAQARSFFSLAGRMLHTEGRCLTLDPCLNKGQHCIARVLIHLDRGRNVRTAQEYAALASASFSDVSQTLRHDLLRVPYTHLIMECRKS